jgi:Fe-S-cluster containining protein
MAFKTRNKVITNLKTIAKLAKKREKENINFRVFLKGQDFKKIDKMVHRLNDLISAKIDCTECANCCKYLHPVLTKNDVERLSAIKNLSETDFKLKYLEKDPYDNDQYLKHTPCIFLNDKLCNIYEDRPETCQFYPHLHKTNFISRSLGAISNYEICPIVFNVIEELKTELNYKY